MKKKNSSIDKNIQEVVKTLFDIDLTPKQLEITKAILNPKQKRIVISAFTRYGKTFIVAIATILYLVRNPGHRILLVSPKIDQTRIIRDYIANFIVDSGLAEELIDFSSDKTSRIKKEISKNMITFKNGCSLKMLSAEGTAERLMGWGGELIILDESCLVDYEVYRTKISRMLGDNANSKLVEIGNPWHRRNQMYTHWLDTSFLKIHVGYKTGLEEGRITSEFLADQKQLLSPIEFKILYEADFPADTEDTLIKHDWIKNAQRDIPDPNMTPVVLVGVDCARYGEDLTVFTVVHRFQNLYKVFSCTSKSKQSITKTVGDLINIIQVHSPDKILIDDGGLGGGVTDGLKEYLDNNYRDVSKVPEIKPLVMGSRAEDSPNNLNKKTDVYMHLKKLFEEGNIIIPQNSTLVSQLSMMLYEITSNGKVKILDNQEKSPDFADSLAYACYDNQSDVIIDFGGYTN